MRRWITASYRATIPSQFRLSATACRPRRLTGCCGSGSARCRTPLRPKIGKPVISKKAAQALAVAAAPWHLRTLAIQRPLWTKVYTGDSYPERPDAIFLVPDGGFLRRDVRKGRPLPPARSARAGCRPVLVRRPTAALQALRRTPAAPVGHYLQCLWRHRRRRAHLSV